MFSQCQNLSSVHVTINCRWQIFQKLRARHRRAAAVTAQLWMSTAPSPALISGPSIGSGSIRPLSLSPLRAQLPHARPTKKPAGPDFGTGTGPVGSNFTSLLQIQVWKGKVDKKACQSKHIDERSAMGRSTWLYLFSVRSY